MQVLYLLIIFFTELSILLHDFMQSCLHSVLTAAKRITVTVQETIHIGTFHHLHQDGGQLSFQGQQTLIQQRTRFQLCATHATNISVSFKANLQSTWVKSQLSLKSIFTAPASTFSSISISHFSRQNTISACSSPRFAWQSLSRQDNLLENVDTAEALKNSYGYHRIPLGSSCNRRWICLFPSLHPKMHRRH